MKAAEYRQRAARSMSEKDFQAEVLQLAKAFGWSVYHPFDSRRSAHGWPDLAMVNPVQRRAMFRELKTETGRLTVYQKTWQANLLAAGLDVGVWRPADLMSGRVLEELKGVR